VLLFSTKPDEAFLRGRGRTAQLRCQTRGVSSLQREDYLGSLERSGLKGKLGNESQIVLNIHLKILITEDMTSLLENFSEFSRDQSVVVVVRDPGLKAAHRILSKRSTTIDKSFADSSNLGHVRVRGGQFTTWKPKSNGGIGGVGKGLRKFGDTHGESV
jgi:hypothetical protein